MRPADLFAALADPTRCKMVEMLHEKARPVHELAGAFDISRPAISRHLRVLKEAGLVHEEKRGRENVYALRRGPFKPLTEWLGQHAGLAPEAPPPAPAPVVVVESRPKPKRPAEALPQLAFDL